MFNIKNLFATFLILLSVFSCDKSNDITTIDLSLQNDRLDKVKLAENQIKIFFSDLTTVLEDNERKDDETIYAQLENLGYELDLNNNSQEIAISSKIDLDNTDFWSDDFENFLVSKLQSHKESYLVSGEDKYLGEFLEVAILIEMVTLFKTHEELSRRVKFKHCLSSR